MNREKNKFQNGCYSCDKLKDNMKNDLDPGELQKKLEVARQCLIKKFMIVNFAVKTIPLTEFMNQLEKDLIKYALYISEENQKKAAYILGLNAPTLCEKMKRHNIKMDKSDKEFAFTKSLQEISTFFSFLTKNNHL